VGLERAKYAVEQIKAGQTLAPRPASRRWVEPRYRRLLSQPAVRVAMQAGSSLLSLCCLSWPGGIHCVYVWQWHWQAHDPETPLALLPSAAQAAPEIAGVFFNANADTRSIGLVDPATGKLLWQASQIARGWECRGGQRRPGFDLWPPMPTDLLAYHKNDGSLAWQAQMSDKLNYGADTLLVTAGRVDNGQCRPVHPGLRCRERPQSLEQTAGGLRPDFCV